MAAKRDYYEVLGVSKSADADAIKKAYRKLAKKYLIHTVSLAFPGMHPMKKSKRHTGN